MARFPPCSTWGFLPMESSNTGDFEQIQWFWVSHVEKNHHRNSMCEVDIHGYSPVRRAHLQLEMMDLWYDKANFVGLQRFRELPRLLNSPSSCIFADIALAQKQQHSHHKGGGFYQIVPRKRASSTDMGTTWIQRLHIKAKQDRLQTLEPQCSYVLAGALKGGYWCVSPLKESLWVGRKAPLTPMTMVKYDLLVHWNWTHK